MKNFFKKLLAPHHLEYLAVDRELLIREASPQALRFAECPDEVRLGNDVRLAFPELFGTEELLLDICEGRLPSFEFKAITRVLENNQRLYFDLYILDFKEEEDQNTHLIIFLEDVTDRMALEQTLVQATNEQSLLLSALANAKNYIEKIISSMAEVLLVTSASGKIKKVNQTAQTLFGYSEAELMGQSIAKIIVDEKFLHQLSEPSLFTQEQAQVTCRSKIGQKLTVAFSCSTIQAESDRTLNQTSSAQDLVYIGRDITAQQRTQQRELAQHATTFVLSESMTQQQALEELLPVLCESLGWDVGEVWMPEEDDRLLSKNQHKQPTGDRPLLRCVASWVQPSLTLPELKTAHQSITLAPGEGLPGQIWASSSCRWIADLLTEAESFLTQQTAAFDFHGAFGFPILGDYEESLQTRPVLGVITFLSRFPQQPDEDLLQTMISIGSQIGQFIKRKQAEEALRESEERLRDLFENASDLIQSVTADGHFAYVNRAWRDTLGYSEVEITNLTVFDILHPDSKAQGIEILRRVLSGEQIDRVQAEFITKQGQKISVEGSVNCKWVGGKPVGTRAIFRDITERLKAEKALRWEQEKSDRLLLNILPEPIADRLKQEQHTIAEDFANATVLFADIVGFTTLSASMSPIALVDLLNQIFSAFDRLSEQHALEKIKTIGDAYMVVGGLPTPKADHAEAIAQMALDMQTAIAEFNAKNNKAFSIRIGIHSGPVVAGVIGLKKFIYDLWGDTVNLASRMESHGLAGRIQVSDATYQLLKDKFILQKRGTIQIKGKGEMTTYFLTGKKNDEGLKNLDFLSEGDLHRGRSGAQWMVERISDKLREN
ncbi:MAG: adenylate/guanylate cyclase domain-containing protein [Actinomycetota bacterium]